MGKNSFKIYGKKDKPHYSMTVWQSEMRAPPAPPAVQQKECPQHQGKADEVICKAGSKA